jgi:hypothetical protein
MTNSFPRTSRHTIAVEMQVASLANLLSMAGQAGVRPE